MNELLGKQEASEVRDYQVTRFMELLREIFNCCRDRENYQSSKFSLPRAEMDCLLLFCNERYLTVKSIALKLEISKSRVTKLIEGLIQKGLVNQMNDPTDGRVRLISLTSRGIDKIEEIQSFQQEVYTRILENVEPEYRKNLLFYLEALRVAMKETEIQLFTEVSRS